jgi:hypothetical protein
MGLPVVSVAPSAFRRRQQLSLLVHPNRAHGNTRPYGQLRNGELGHRLVRSGPLSKRQVWAGSGHLNSMPILHIIRVFTLVITFMRVNTLTMNLHHTTSTCGTADHGGRQSTSHASTHDAWLWVFRGFLVGLALGSSAGSVIPIAGTLVGAVIGAVFGLAIGLSTALFSVVTRRLFPTNPSRLEAREKIACLAVIWSPIPVMFFVDTLRTTDALILIPMALGSIHAVAAGTPAPNAVYTGNVSKVRVRVCKLLPIAILGLIAAMYIVIGIASLRH